MSDNHHDDIPVKDIPEAHRTKSLVMENQRGLRRDELHDRMLQLNDENVFLKKHARKFEEKAKHLEAKLNRILSEKKFGVRKDEIDAEESKHRIIELEYQVGMLKDRLQVSKQQLASYTQLFPIHAKAKPRPTKAQGSISATTTVGGAESVVPSEVAEQFEVILLEAKAENHALESQVKHLRDEIRSLERELATMKELLQIKEVTHEDELNILRAQVGDAEQTKRKLADNIQLIRVQRDSRKASSWLSTLETQCKALEASLSSAQENNQQLEAELNSVQEQLRESQQENLNLQKQVEDNVAEINRIKELEAQIASLQEENGIFKETNQSLQSKLTAAGEKVRQVETEEVSLRTQISNMEITLKKEVQSKTDLYSEVSREKSRAQTLQETLQDLQKKFSAMEQELKQMEKASLSSVSSVALPDESRRIPVTTMSSEVVVVEVENGNQETYLAKQESSTQITINELNGVSVAQCDYCKLLEKNLAETRASMDKLHDDLIKTKNLLKNQLSTNRECHKEIEVLSTKLEKADKFHHEKLQEFMKVLEERAEQMQALEKNLEVIKSQSRLNIMNTDAQIQVETSEIAANDNASRKPLPTSVTVSEANGTKTSSVVDVDKSSPSPPPSRLPSVELFLDTFIPYAEFAQLGKVNLFATWELNETTKYSPMVREGIFGSSSTHVMLTEKLKTPVPIQLHEAIGASDCKAVGSGVLHPEATVCTISSMEEPKKIIGELKYKMNVHGLSLQYETSSPPEQVESMENTGSTPPVSVQSSSPPAEQAMPKPKPRKIPTPAEMEVYSSLTETSEGDDRSLNKSGRLKSKRKKSEAIKYIKKCLSPKHDQASSRSEKAVSPKKPILRRESTSPEGKKKLVKRVTLTELVEERRIPSSDDEKSQRSLPVPLRKPEISLSSSDTSGEGSELQHTPITSTPAKITVQSIESSEDFASKAPTGTQTTTATSTTEQEPSSGSGEETVRRPSTAVASKTRKKRSRKTGGTSSGSSLELSENDSSSQDSEAYKQIVRIEISYVIFNSPCRIWGDPNVKKLFIEYRFLDFDPEELETPNAIPKPQPGKKGEYNFVKVFQIDTKERRRLLEMMLHEKKRIRFTLVSEPCENDTLDCEDIGYAYVPIVSLLKEDIVQELIAVYDAENPRSEIGSICVSIQARQALKSL